MVSPVITGYYRYTDIFFEWHQALPDPDDRSPLKAALAQDAIVHPEHPLRREGVDGAELYMGTLQNFETRLLFSSAQVEYLRYWLHAMQLTKNLIPLPYSDCLLTESSLRHVSPVQFQTKEELRKALKQIEKNNRRLKGVDPTLNTRRDIFERVRSFWSRKQGVWCALDFEAWDRDHTLLTEFGWSIVRWEDEQQIEERGHLTVKEHKYYTNTFVPDNRERFSFGTSEEVSKTTFKQRIQTLVSELQTAGPLFLVFHDNSQDIKYLKSKNVEVQLPNMAFLLPDTLPQDGVFIIDTSDLFAALEGEGGGNRRSLDRVCRHLQIPTAYLHNAGNDAHYTLLALQSMASGDPIDMQREKRWPNRTGSTGVPNQPQTGAGIKVNFDADEGDEDFSDEEGPLGSTVDTNHITSSNGDADDEK
ncbi:hypothetical protein PAXRUDRAFT_13075 [Paxillus rubicundulus Ve08.2h10]|uniref:Gfd2/YDR514C-like C-terminal domain-containing protein n=1 Tax=Paxillus rubicundulus Ve08.2h10 TaxID=930991 RepID=A0A0D0D727_9AGAM|nr:hypothetical protein PAXRUDRAFT_13075 [Paxillus rubicundulus Ve08.2h10]